MSTNFTQAKERLRLAAENIQLQDGDLRSRVIDAWLSNLNYVNTDTLPEIYARQLQEIENRLMQGRLRGNLGQNEIRDIAKKIIRLADDLIRLDV